MILGVGIKRPRVGREPSPTHVPNTALPLGSGRGGWLGGNPFAQAGGLATGWCGPVAGPAGQPITGARRPGPVGLLGWCTH